MTIGQFLSHNVLYSAIKYSFSPLLRLLIGIFYSNWSIFLSNDRCTLVFRRSLGTCHNSPHWNAYGTSTEVCSLSFLWVYDHRFSRHIAFTLRVNNKIVIKNSISLKQNNFFSWTQAFASPPDLASSGVWELGTCHTPDEAKSGGLAKACVQEKKLFCFREIEFFMIIQTEWEVYMHVIKLLLLPKIPRGQPSGKKTEICVYVYVCGIGAKPLCLQRPYATYIHTYTQCSVFPTDRGCFTWEGPSEASSPYKRPWWSP